MARSRRRWVTLLGVVMLALSVAWWRGRTAAPPPAPVDLSEPERTSPPELPGSLRGTEVDGELAVGADGRLVVVAGGSDAEVFALREQAFGRAAAERLAALDAERRAP